LRPRCLPRPLGDTMPLHDALGMAAELFLPQQKIFKIFFGAWGKKSYFSRP
jgi:hypothetical protein